MKQRLYLIIMLCAVTLSGMAQTVGEAFYVYRNDGQFNAFFRDEVISIDYSYEDADGNTYNEIVTQIINTPDSVYKIPLAVIDSVGFVQPETIVSTDVFPLTEHHSPYITNGDVLSFDMSASAPKTLRPKKGNIVVATAECTAFPNGIIARVESVTLSGSFYHYACSQAYYDEVFDQLVTYQAAIGDGETSAARGFDLRRATLNATLWDVNWTRTIEGGGTTTSLNVGDRATASVTVCKTLTTPFYFQLHLQNAMTSGVDFNAQSTASISKELQIGSTITAGRISIPYTMGLLWLEPKLSLFGYFEEQGKVELNYSGHFNRTDDVTFTYSQGEWNFNHTPVTDIGTDVASLSMEGSAEIGLKPQIDFSLNGQQAGFGLSARAGLKEYINFIFDTTRLADGGLYDAMRDSYCRTTIPWSVTVHANANIFSRYEASQSDEGFATFSHSFAPAEEPQWGEDRYIFPLFDNVKGERQGNDKAIASANVSRTTLLPVQVGFSLIDEDNNILQTMYDNRSYRVGSLFSDYSCTLSNLTGKGKYTVCPSVKLLGYDVLASPSAELNMDFPVVLSDFKVTKKQYQQDGFTHNGQQYDYRFDVTVTATFDNDVEGIVEWGYVYLDPNGKEAFIPLTNFGHTYTDSRYAYFRNGTPPFTCTLYGYVKYAGIDKPVYGEVHEYPLEYGETSCPDANHPHMIDLGLPSGTKWACCNVGANTPEDYGNYYAWGETQPKSVYNWSSYQYGYYNNDGDYSHLVNIGSDIAGTQYDAATANWGAPWRMPSLNHIQELLNNCSNTWTTQNGVTGRKFTGPNGGTIFLPAAGVRWDGGFVNGGFVNVGSYGYYWSSTLYEYPFVAYSLSFRSGDAWEAYGDLQGRSGGLSVRPVR